MIFDRNQAMADFFRALEGFESTNADGPRDSFPEYEAPDDYPDDDSTEDRWSQALEDDEWEIAA
jgi:hypothetical protein